MSVSPPCALRIVGNFQGLTFAMPTFAMPKDATLPNFTEKTFASIHKTAKFMKAFSLESFPLVHIIIHTNKLGSAFLYSPQV